MQLRINRLYFRNVFIFSGEYDFVFPENGLCLVEGVNLDAGGSNGSGKTSFLNLIPTCLFEDNNSGLIKDNIIHRGRDSAEIRLNINDDLAVIYRRGKQLTWEIWSKNNKLKAEKSTDTLALIKDIIKLDYNQYTSFIHLCQGATLGFFNLSGAERLKIFTEILNLGQFDRASEIAKEKYNQILIEIEKDESRLLEIRSQEQSLRQNIADIYIEPLDVLGKQQQELEAELSGYVQKSQMLNQAIVQYQLEINSLDKAMQELVNQRALIQERETQVQKIKNDIFRLEDEINKIKSTLIDENEIERLFKERNNYMKKYQEQISTLSLERMKCLAGLQSLDAILGLDIGEDCPVCGRGLDEKFFSKRLSHLRKEQDELNKKIGEIEIKLEDYEQKIQDIQKELQELENRKKQNFLQINQLNRLEERLALTQKQFNERNTIEQDISNVMMREEEYKIKKAELVEKVQKLQMEFGDLQLHINNLHRKHQDILMRIAQTNKMIEIKARYENELVDVIERKQMIEKKQIENKDEIAYFKWWQNAFKKVKILELETAVQVLQSYIDYYMEILFDNRLRLVLDIFKYKKTKKDAFDFKNELNISVIPSDIPLSGFSGGEKQLMGLAMLLAFNDFYSLNFVILDEIFGSLDLVNRERVTKLLEHIRHKKLIFIVTHLEEIRSMLEWDKVLHIERKNGSSTVMWA